MPFITPDPSPNPPPPIGDISDYGVTVGATTATISDWVASLQAGGGGPEAALTSNGTIATSSVGCSFVRNAPGQYTISLDVSRDNTDSAVLVSGGQTLPGGTEILYQYAAPPDIIVFTADITSGLLADCAFSFALFVVT